MKHCAECQEKASGWVIKVKVTIRISECQYNVKNTVLERPPQRKRRTSWLPLHGLDQFAIMRNVCVV